MKIACISDLHGRLPFNVPECDILVIAGDICPDHVYSWEFQANWLNIKFARWLKRLPAKNIVWIAGNHDFCLQYSPDLLNFKKLSGHYLNNSSVEIEGLTIWGSPYSLPLLNWAFMAKEDRLEMMYNTIPEHTDIIVSHGPPYGYGDAIQDWEKARSSIGGGEDPLPEKHLGSHALLNAVNKIEPDLLVCGHCHVDRGTSQCGKTLIVNASMVNAAYELVHKPILVEI